jgi:hypothetical protein
MHKIQLALVQNNHQGSETSIQNSQIQNLLSSLTISVSFEMQVHWIQNPHLAHNNSLTHQ